MTVYQRQSTAWPAPVQKLLPSYPYWQYSDDINIQAFFSAYNGLAQSYLNWFNQTPLSVYTNDTIFGPLLDWIGQGIYGIARPVLSSSSSLTQAGYNSLPYNVIPYNGVKYSASGTASVANDDVYKRVLTWSLYLGDGKQFSIDWLKRRVARFTNGPNGIDAAVLDFLPSVTISASAVTIDLSGTAAHNTPIAKDLQQLIADGILPLPFELSFTVTT